jgi:hypothetical protein
MAESSAMRATAGFPERARGFVTKVELGAKNIAGWIPG